jgi:hypothetical protein
VRVINLALKPAPILRALIAAVPEDRLRDLVLELALPRRAVRTAADARGSGARSPGQANPPRLV